MVPVPTLVQFVPPLLQGLLRRPASAKLLHRRMEPGGDLTLSKQNHRPNSTAATAIVEPGHSGCGKALVDQLVETGANLSPRAARSPMAKEKRESNQRNQRPSPSPGHASSLPRIVRIGDK